MMQAERRPVLFLIPLDIAVGSSALYLAYLIRVQVLTRLSDVWRGRPPLWPSYAVLLLGTLPILLIALHASRGYAYSVVRSIQKSAWASIRTLVLGGIGVLAFAYVLRDHTFSRAIVSLYLLFSTAGFFLVRAAYAKYHQTQLLRGNGLDRLLIVGTGRAAKEIRDILSTKRYLGYQVIGFVDVPDEDGRDASVRTLGSIDDLPALVDELVVDAVLFATPLDKTAKYEGTIWKLEEVGKTIHLRGDAVGVLLSRTFVGEFQGIPILTLQSTPGDPFALALKRGMDVVLSIVGLVILSPVMLTAAAAIKLTSPGPVFFRQERVGLNGRRFKMLKFRSMYMDAEKRREDLLQNNEAGGPVFKMRKDPRVTPVGRVLRKFSIDELPQLINVLRGEMSIVGPRPPLPSEVAQYERWQRRRLSMKPGLTCIWQVSGRSDVPFEEWMKMDMEYIDNWSILLDLKIILKTLPVVILGKGAY